MKTLLLLGIALALISAAQAYPTLTGPTGLATLPTAAIAATGQLQVAADYFNAEEWEGTVYPVRLLYGVNDSLEIGAAYWLNSDQSNAWGVNAKYLLPIKLADMPWAVGASYLNFPDWSETFTQVYFVGSKAFTEASAGMPGFNGTIGVNWTQDDWDFGTDDAIRLYAGLEAIFANNLSVAGEFQTKNEDVDDNAIWSLVARYPFTPVLTGQVGVTNAFGPFGWFDDSHVFAGASYAFGMGGSSE